MVKKRIGIIMMCLYAIGQLTLVFTRIFEEKLSKFEMGFLEGYSVVFIIAGFLFMGVCLRKKINPFTLKEWQS